MAETAAREELVRTFQNMLEENPHAARVRDAALTLEDLSRNGIRTLSEEDTGQEGVRRRFIIPVYGLEALAVWSNAPDRLISGSGGGDARKFRELMREEYTLSIRSAMKTAIRAIYVLGLDFGVVELAASEHGRPAVTRVVPVPPASRRMEVLFSEAIELHRICMEVEGKRESSAVLGTDPEFVLRRPGGKVVPASRYFEKRGPVGCDAVRFGRRLLYPLVELRPKPSSDVLELLRALRGTMRVASRRIEEGSLEWLAGGMPAAGLPLGGHIHMSGLYLNGRLLRALDNYLALPLVLVEDDTTADRRKRYGFLGDFRRQFHGGFEYRTPPSWIVSPRISAGVLALASLLSDHYRKLDYFPLRDPQVQRHYYDGAKQELLPIVEKLWGELEKAESYRALERFLRPLREQMLRLESWEEQRDIRPAWKIAPYDLSGFSKVNMI
ncbi:putative amidoligase domain-containing protein [Paenibacillus turpanensis]|uniref:putative amidoligase domain-containing protein n=1 Tax=Paenibacillus turpanensis TaxID=2689078 RepID=UPI003132C69D